MQLHRLLALVLLGLALVAGPHRAQAQATSTTTMCDDGSYDNDVLNNRNAHQQNLVNIARNINSLFPIAPALSQCVKNVMNIFSQLPKLGDPLGIAQAVINPIIQSLISGVCGQVMGVITSAQSALTNMAQICLPSINFGSLSLTGFSGTSCGLGNFGSGTTVNLITGFSGAPMTPTYNSSQYMGK